MIDIKYSQNFYTNEENLKKIITSANISSNDTVIDIGAGEGNITQELAKHTQNIIAYEKDSYLYNNIKENLSLNSNICIKNEDFLESKLPTKEFKVFANIPFFLTTNIINKLTQPESQLTEAYLFIQKEAAERFIGKPLNTQIATILSLKYEISIFEQLSKKDFNPQPNVEIVIVQIKRRVDPEKEFLLFRDFVTYIFNQRNPLVMETLNKLFTYAQKRRIKKHINNMKYIKPSDMPAIYYKELFKLFKTNGDSYKNKVKGYYKKNEEQHLKRETINRTRK